MKYIKVFEAYERPKSPETHSKWIKSGENDTYTILGAGEKYVRYVNDNEPSTKIEDTIVNFLKEFKPVLSPVKEEESKKDMYKDIELDFNKSIFIPVENVIIAPYMITKDNESSIEVLNIKEYASQSASFWDEATPYTVTFHRLTLPKSQITILNDVEGKEGFKYIRIPYWLYKKNSDDLTIKRCVGTYHKMKRLDVRDAGLSNHEFMRNFKDTNVQKYFKATDSDERTHQLINIYNSRNY
jgi:hypothetical protein